MPVTFDKAEAVSPFDLARLWADRLEWPMNGTAHDELAELACMSALARWLTRWQPIQIHRAVLRGAEPAAVAAALGCNITDAFGCWHSWALRQQDSVIRGTPGVTAEEYQTVTAVFAFAGMASGEKPLRA
jgi:hypothetical protein